MNTIEINAYPKHNLDTFLLILPSKYYYVEGETYIIQEFFNKNLIGEKVLVDKKTMPMHELTDGMCYMAKDCDFKLFFQIVRTQYKTRLDQYKLELLPEDIRSNYKVGSLYSFINKETLMDVMVFTEKHCVKSLTQTDMQKHLSKIPDPTISLTSKKPIGLGKNYDFEKFQKRAEKLKEFQDKQS